MTQDELIKNITWLAQEAGLQTAYPIDHPMSKFIMAIEARATEKEREACAELRKTIWCPITDSKLKGAVNNALDFYSARILARKEVGDVNPM